MPNTSLTTETQPGKLAAEQITDALMRNPAFMAVAVNEHGIVTFFNAAAEKGLGYRADEIIGKQTPDLWRDKEELKQYADELSAEFGRPIKPEIEAFIKLRRASIADREWTYIRKDGSRFPVFLSVVPIKDAQNNLTGYLGISKDITQVRQHQRAATNHEIFLNAVISHLADGLITTNSKGIVQNYNTACEKLFGYKATEVIGKNISMLMAEPDHSKNDYYFERYLKSGEGKTAGVRREVKGQCKDGSVFPFDFSLNQLEMDGTVVFCVTVHDVSERDRAKEEREQLIEKLTESNAEFERFAYVASHDMQEPLRTMNSFSELILAEYSKVLDEDGKTYLNLIRDAAARMQSLVVDLLEYARMGKGAVHLELFSADEEYTHVLQNLLTMVVGNNAKITSDPLPQLKGDRVQFLRLLQNLIGNGLKYHRDDVLPAVHVHAEDKADYWLFSIADNGIGIEGKNLMKVFEPFKRLHSQQEYAGTGLGLTVCKRIVENHSGRIWCVSTLGKGSTFYFTWPK